MDIEEFKIHIYNKIKQSGSARIFINATTCLSKDQISETDLKSAIKYADELGLEYIYDYGYINGKRYTHSIRFSL